MSCTKSDFAEIAQPRRRRDRGIGEHPNKQENVRPRESGSRAIFRKCIYTCIACRFLRIVKSTDSYGVRVRRVALWISFQSSCCPQRSQNT